MAAHRFWRVILQGGSVALSALELRSTIGGADVSGLATRSGGHANWFDSTDSTETSTGDPVVVTFDFGAAQAVLELALRTNAAGTNVPKGIAILGSDTGLFWTVYGPPVDPSGTGAATWWTFSGFVPVTPNHAVGSTLHWAGGSPSGALATRVVGQVVRHDTHDSGPCYFAWVVMTDGTPPVPVRRRVRLFHMQSGRLIRETWSSAVDGSFRFDGLKDQEYLLVSDDHTRIYNSARAAMVRPQPP